MMMDDIQEVMFTEEMLRKKVSELAKEIEADYRDTKEDIYFIGIMKGAVVFYTDLVRCISLPVRFDFMAVSSYGNGTESSGTVRIQKDMDFDVAGHHVVVVEDIVDSGNTMAYLRKHLEHKRAASVRICALLSKPSRREVDVKIDYCGFETPDAFLVGYGLDYAGKYRNLPYIGVLKPEVYEH